MKSQLKGLVLLACASFAGCMHRYQPSEENNRPVLKVSVPLIEGDKLGQLTATIIRTLCNESIYWQYEPVVSEADYTVHLRVASHENHPLGFRYDSLNIYDSTSADERAGVDFIDEPIDRLVQDEVRSVMVLEGYVSKKGSDKKVGTPFKVEGSCSYDYINSYAVFDAAFINPKGDLESVLDFSLGQLDGLDGAKSSSTQALYNNVATHFVEGFNQFYFQLEKATTP